MSRFGSLVLLIVGALLLLNNLGWLRFHFGGMLRVWWPLLLILIGTIGLLVRSR